LALASGRSPDLVVLDLMLPGIDGLQVCRRLRSRTGDLPVVMLTALGEENDRVLGLEVGADDYLTKPFSPGSWCCASSQRPALDSSGWSGWPRSGSPAAGRFGPRWRWWPW